MSTLNLKLSKVCSSADIYLHTQCMSYCIPTAAAGNTEQAMIAHMLVFGRAAIMHSQSFLIAIYSAPLSAAMSNELITLESCIGESH